MPHPAPARPKVLVGRPMGTAAAAPREAPPATAAPVSRSNVNATNGRRPCLPASARWEGDNKLLHAATSCQKWQVRLLSGQASQGRFAPLKKPPFQNTQKSTSASQAVQELTFFGVKGSERNGSR